MFYLSRWQCQSDHKYPLSHRYKQAFHNSISNSYILGCHDGSLFHMDNFLESCAWDPLKQPCPLVEMLMNNTINYMLVILLATLDEKICISFIWKNDLYNIEECAFCYQRHCFFSCYHSSVHHSKTLLLKQFFHMFLRFPTCVLREIVMFSRTKQLGFLTSKNKHMNANGKNCALTYNLFSLFGSYHYIYFICGILSFHCLELILLLLCRF